MDEFELESTDMGTSVCDIKSTVSDRKYKEDKLSKKDLNMNQLARNLELKLDMIDKPVEKVEEKDTFHEIKNFKHTDLILYIFFFILFNTKFIIELLNKNLSYIHKNNLSWNLFIRTLLFSIVIYVVKKLN
jgi:hypothetical protein